MILNLLVIVGVLVTAAVWGSKAKGYGLFSAFLALVCTVAAGGVAFAAWEPVALAMLSAGKNGASFFDGLLQDSAWCIGLLGPFLISLLAFRLLLDLVVKKNLEFSDNANTIGGLAIGLCIGVISIGITTISLGFLRLPPDLLGYQPIEEKQGNPVYTRSLWLPADKIVVSLYSKLSTGAFASSTPLALHRPNVFQQAGMQRMTFKGQSRTSLAPSDFQVIGRYRISGKAEDLLKDSFLGTTQKAIYPDNTALSSNDSATLEGYVLRFESSAKEKGGNFVATPGQLRLICERNGRALALHPIAVVAKPEAAKAGLYRFRFDASEAFISSVGGGSESTFAFEFLLPEGAEPVDLLVKNARVAVDADSALPEETYRSADHRDAAVRDGSIVASFRGASPGGAGPLDTSGSIRARAAEGVIAGISSTPTLPGNGVLNKSNRGSLEVNEQNEITSGEQQMASSAFGERGLDKNLRIDRFASSRDTGIVQVTLSNAGERSIFGEGVERTESSSAPILIDQNGTRYEPIGFYYAEGEIVRVRFTPGLPIRSIDEAPRLSRTKRDQTLILIYRPSMGVRIASFAMGDKELVNFGGTLEVK